MIDEVEALGPELQVHTFHQAERLEERSVHRQQARALKDVPAGVSVETGGRKRECVRIEPFGLLPYDDWAGEARLERNAIRVSSVPAPGLMESHQRRQ